MAKDTPRNRSKAPKDGPPSKQPDKPGSSRTTVIPAEIWLGTETEPGLIDYPWELRVELLREAREEQGPMWGPPEWTPEDERKWQTKNYR